MAHRWSNSPTWLRWGLPAVVHAEVLVAREVALRLLRLLRCLEILHLQVLLLPLVLRLVLGLNPRRLQRSLRLLGSLHLPVRLNQVGQRRQALVQSCRTGELAAMLQKLAALPELQILHEDWSALGPVEKPRPHGSV